MPEKTVKIQSKEFPEGLTINEADYDEKEHKLFVEKPPKDAKTSKAADETETEEWTLPKLMKQTKDELLEIANGLDVTYDTPDDVTKETIANDILEAE